MSWGPTDFEIDLIKGPALPWGAHQTDLQDGIRELIDEVLLQDPAYVARIKEDCRLFRDRIDQPVVPAPQADRDYLARVKRRDPALAKP